MDYIEQLMKDCYPEGIDDSTLDDLIRFDLLDMMEDAGIYNTED